MSQECKVSGPYVSHAQTNWMFKELWVLLGIAGLVFIGMVFGALRHCFAFSMIPQMRVG